MFEGLGFASTWDFLRRDLKLLECATSRRIKSARLIGRYPAALDRLRDGRLSMAALALVEPVINDANAECLFDKVDGKSRDHIKKLVADLKAEPTAPPPPKRPFTFRKAPAPVVVVASADVVELRDLSAAPAAPPEVEAEPEPTRSPEPAPSPEADAPVIADAQPSLFLVRSSEKRADFRPISEDRYDVSMRVSARFVDLLKEAAAAESHAVPDGNPEAILMRGLELLLERSGKKTGKVAVKPSAKPATDPDPDSAYIPASLRREVFARDGHRCVWPLTSGGTCDLTHCLEPDHIEPHAKGGKTLLSNLRLLCRAHNQQAAREAFGDELIEDRIRRSKPR